MEVSLLFGLLSVAVAIWLALRVRSADPGNEAMREVALAIQDGAKAYLNRQIVTISFIAVLLFVVLAAARDIETALGFLVGAACSLVAGYLGMRIAVLANVRTANAARQGRQPALKVAFNGGAVTGLLVVGLALISVGVFFLVVRQFVELNAAVASLVGLALGSSLISVFARLGGGIYTKAADVGADLVGKIEQNLDEDDPRNPATIADNVGDNVGDCAGMAADVFETYAVSLIGAVLIAVVANVSGTNGNLDAYIAYPFLIGGVAVIGSLLGIWFINVAKLSPSSSLMGGVVVAAVVTAGLLWPVTQILFGNGWTDLYMSCIVGLVMTALVVAITNYYTSTEFSPVRKIAKASETGHATNIIAGLAVGQHATAFPVGLIGIAILFSYSFSGLYGVAIAVMSMLSLAGIIISLDAFGPITDNAGGIAVMSELDPEVRKVTDELDAVGNTMKAVTKGYAIASAGLAALVLFGSYVEELKIYQVAETATHSLEFSLQKPEVIIGLFIGGLLPFLFTAYSMDAVGKAAGAVVREVRRQLKARPGIINGTDKPEYANCVDIVTKAALQEMIWPALLPVIVVVGVAAIPGLQQVVLGGVLVGTIVTGLFIAIAMTSSGGAWDNAKKYIEEGHHGGKGSEAHAAAVTGDTVGDPYKDTAGPAVNPMIKVVNVVAILIIPIFFAGDGGHSQAPAEEPAPAIEQTVSE
ncbi:MAG: sodium-translocating pyrophosphatase [Verrucomicrobiota bacterium]